MVQIGIRTAQLSPSELVRLGQEIYERDLRAELEPEHNDEFVVIHVVNGDHVVDEDRHRAYARMREKYPDDVFYAARVGHRAAVQLRSPRIR